MLAKKDTAEKSNLLTVDQARRLNTMTSVKKKKS